ncbi:uncharacterized protein HMPREF1541_04977 [Cyphellophora europaea CBS 101466]|uniref:Glyoxalase/fosfomycin resistance/dioxygenase domain-containing protein n=1 Tax=Cyphellophora europaea (strain CBS 101466) TaxID=1220924 RepID=W2RY31_CYPE1|nr:uncharacterized protein HMPREF1541_04977 [Cyphellophora europaea CBS 101466]ETN40698.1 hypothetical protein HMPREF1541_04977 [Cyphellophora europaea CBS 101466]
MLASLGLGFFPSDMERCLRFYIDALGFQMRERKDNYAFFGERIFLAAIKIESDETLKEKEHTGGQPRPWNL